MNENEFQRYENYLKQVKGEDAILLKEKFIEPKKCKRCGHNIPESVGICVYCD